MLLHCYCIVIAFRCGNKFKIIFIFVALNMQMQMSSGNSRCNYLSLENASKYRLFSVQLEYHHLTSYPYPTYSATFISKMQWTHTRTSSSAARNWKFQLHSIIHNSTCSAFECISGFPFRHQQRGIYYKTHNGVKNTQDTADLSISVFLSHI